MEYLTIKYGPFIIVRKVIGVLTLLCAILMLASKPGSIRVFDWILFITFLISGASLLTNGFGIEKSYIQAGEGFLKVKWMNRFRPVLFQESEIEKITLTRFKVIIWVKKKKESEFKMDFLEREQKKDVYDFLIEYTKKSNVDLSRDF